MDAEEHRDSMKTMDISSPEEQGDLCFICGIPIKTQQNKRMQVPEAAKLLTAAVHSHSITLETAKKRMHSSRFIMCSSHKLDVYEMMVKATGVKTVYDSRALEIESVEIFVKTYIELRTVHSVIDKTPLPKMTSTTFKGSLTNFFKFNTPPHVLKKEEDKRIKLISSSPPMKVPYQLDCIKVSDYLKSTTALPSSSGLQGPSSEDRDCRDPSLPMESSRPPSPVNPVAILPLCIICKDKNPENKKKLSANDAAKILMAAVLSKETSIEEAEEAICLPKLKMCEDHCEHVFQMMVKAIGAKSAEEIRETSWEILDNAFQVFRKLKKARSTTHKEAYLKTVFGWFKLTLEKFYKEYTPVGDAQGTANGQDQKNNRNSENYPYGRPRESMSPRLPSLNFEKAHEFQTVQNPPYFGEIRMDQTHQTQQSGYFDYQHLMAPQQSHQGFMQPEQQYIQQPTMNYYEPFQNYYQQPQEYEYGMMEFGGETSGLMPTANADTGRQNTGIYPNDQPFSGWNPEQQMVYTNFDGNQQQGANTGFGTMQEYGNGYQGDGDVLDFFPYLPEVNQ